MLTEQTQKLISELSDIVTAPHSQFLPKRLKRAGLLRTAFEMLARTWNWEVIPYLIPCLFSEAAQVRQFAKEAAWKLMFPQGWEARFPWAMLDERVRNYGIWNIWQAKALSGRWLSLTPNKITSLDAKEEWTEALILVGMMHSSGYVRHASLLKSSTLASQRTLPLLFLRLNDWVAPVRESAEQAIRERMTEENARCFVENLPLICRLHKTQRAGSNSVLEEVFQWLRSSACQAALRWGMTHRYRPVRLESYRLALEVGNSASLFGSALSEDAEIRLMAAKAIAERQDAGRQRLFLVQLLQDRFVRVRQIGIALLDRLESTRSEPFLPLLLDPHRKIRAEVREILIQRGISDFTAIYRQTIETGEKSILVAAISGLGETGQSADCQLIAKHLKDPLVKVRKAAIKALARLDANSNREHFWEALFDARPGVSRVALDVLKDQASLIGRERLEERLIGQPVHIKKNLLGLIACLNKWDAVAPLIEATLDNDLEVSEKAKTLLHVWIVHYNRSYYNPTEEQLARMDTALARASERLDADLKKWLEGFRRIAV